MINVLFICHGNICRSTMAEFVFKDMIKKQGIESKFYVESAATSNEAIGCDTHYGTKEKLDELRIPYTKRKARRVTKEDYNKFDFLICMDANNLRNLKPIVGEDIDKKVYLLKQFVGSNEDIADPWYTGNFDITYNDIVEGLKGFISSCK